jgi:S1-C subfamily serine protease
MSRLTVRTAAVRCLAMPQRVRLPLLALALAALVAGPLVAQGTRTADPDVGIVLGMNVSVSGSDRDTLGLLISNVTRGGPADEAAVDEGNRLAAINGVSLRIDRESVGQRDASDGVFRRLARELAELRSGDEVTLRIFGSGRFRNVTLHPVLPVTPSRAGGRVAPAPAPTPLPSPIPAPDDAAAPASIANVVDGIAALQAQLRRLEQDEGTTTTLDSLAQIEQDLGAIRRRLRDLQGSADRRTSARSAAGDAISGLSLSSVADDLAPYFGDGSEAGLLVLKADDGWSPVRAGDVILRVNGSPATPERLRSAHDSRRAITLDVLRRKRELTLTVDAPGDDR